MVKAFARLGAIGLICCLAITLLASPAGASAKRIFDIKHRSLSVRMSLRGSHGYRIKIQNLSYGRVLLTATKRDTVAEYGVPGRVTRHGLKANFGRFGHISVRFRRTGKPRVAGPPFGLVKCKGRSPIQEGGRFEGTIRFRGERGFTSVAVGGARGSVVRRFKRRCGFRRTQRGAARAASRGRPSSSTFTALLAAARSHSQTVYLESFGGRIESGDGKHGFSLTFVAAGTAERHGRLTIRRAALIEGDPGSILVSPPEVAPVTATVNLPSPFAGIGSYLEGAGSPPSWTGSLQVRLPGVDPVPLTGPGFTAALCRGSKIEKVQSCLRKVEKVIGDATAFGHA